MSDRFEVKKLQYQRASEDLRYFSSLIWKIPSVALAVIAALIAISSNWVHSPRDNGILMLCGMGLLITLIIITKKYRLFEVSRGEFLKELEEDFIKQDIPEVKIMRVETAETLDYLKKRRELRPQMEMRFVDKISYARAYYVLQVLMRLFTILLGYFSPIKTTT